MYQKTRKETHQKTLSARDAGLIACTVCTRVHQNRQASRLHCAHCGARLYSRIPHSMMRTWVLLMAALALYFPANLLPIMRTRSPLGVQDNTLLSGIIYFWKSGSETLALIIFIASVAVPLLKLSALNFLAFSVHTQIRWQPQYRTKLYRIMHQVGRWSMLDIFVLMLTVSLMQFRSLAVVTAGPGALAFALVVVLTMLASMQFDARLIWDASTATSSHHDLSENP